MFLTYLQNINHLNFFTLKNFIFSNYLKIIGHIKVIIRLKILILLIHLQNIGHLRIFMYLYYFEKLTILIFDYHFILL